MKTELLYNMRLIGERTQGIRKHLGQFSLHVVLVFATGLTIGSERAVVPVLGRDVLWVESVAVLCLSGTIVVRWIKEARSEFGTHDPPAPAPESGPVVGDSAPPSAFVGNRGRSASDSAPVVSGD